MDKAGLKKTMRSFDMGIVEELDRRGVSVWLIGDKLRVFPKSFLTDEVRRIVTENRATLVDELRKIESGLPRPYFHQCGDLVIPFNSPKKYHWWVGGHTVRETITEINDNGGKNGYS